MKKYIGFLVVALVMALASASFALELGANITIPDLMSSGTGWWGPQEDNETEPGTSVAQKWDLEAFFLKDGYALTMVGGYDFVNGVDGYDSGDLFIDVDGIVKYGPAASGTGGGYSLLNNSAFGYEYVIQFDMAAMTYDVYALGADTLLSVYYAQNDESNPWRYVRGGDLLQGWDDVQFGYAAGLPSAEVAGLSGTSHNALTVDLSFLAPGTEFISHYTYECGNDNLMGKGKVGVADGGMTAMLLGFALLTVEGIRRKIRR